MIFLKYLFPLLLAAVIVHGKMFLIETGNNKDFFWLDAQYQLIHFHLDDLGHKNHSKQILNHIKQGLKHTKQRQNHRKQDQNSPDTLENKTKVESVKLEKTFDFEIICLSVMF